MSKTQFFINDQAYPWQAMTLADIFPLLQLESTGALALEQQIIPRSQWQATALPQAANIQLFPRLLELMMINSLNRIF